MDEEPWVCQCRRCHGVHNGADAAQYVWEYALGSCGVPVVVGVNACENGFVTCAFVYWHDEPEVPHPIVKGGEFIVSCRPGSGTVPTEGDIARWMSWVAAEQAPRDWLIVDGLKARSVRAVVDALRARSPMPDEQDIAGDWDDALLDPQFREDVRARWTETKRRNQEFHPCSGTVAPVVVARRVYGRSMRTTIVIDDDLLAAAQRVSGAPTKRAIVEYALRELVSRRERRKILDLKGRVQWEGGLARSRS
jgi:Arc/MetJ family transcription regulator